MTTETVEAPELNTVSDAVAEMDRREAARRTERKAARVKADADDVADPEGDDGAEDDDADPRKVKDEAEPEQKPAKVKPKAKADESDEADDAEDGETDDEDESVDIEASDDEGDDAQDEPPKPTKVKVNLGDREVEATPEEISHHVRKANHDAHEARQYAAQIEAQTNQARQQLQQHAQGLQQQGAFWQQVAQRMVGSPPDPQLAHSDPTAFVQQRADYEARVQFLQQIVAQNKQQSEAAAREAHAQQQQATESARQRGIGVLYQVIPDLADPNKAPALTGRLVKVAQAHGFPPEALETVLHPGFIVLLHKAMRADDMDAQRARAREKLAGAPALKSPEPGASTGRRGVDNARRAEAKKAFMKSARTPRDVERYLRLTSQ